MNTPYRLLAFLVGISCCLGAMAQEAGKASRVSGQATITSASNQSKELKRDDVVSVGDTISTSKDSQVMVRMKDNSSLLVPRRVS